MVCLIILHKMAILGEGFPYSMAIFPIILPITGGASRAEQHSFTGSSAWIAWENPGDFPCGFSEKKTSGSQADENGDMIGILFWG